MKKSMKLNLGCGNKKLEGYVNVDLTEYCNPDLILNLENTPYPFKSNSVSEIRMKSVIEHLPIHPDGFFRILKEIYRIAKNNCLLYIECPHPSHRWQIVDLTHQKPIHYEGLEMLSKQYCKKLIQRGSTKSPLAIMYDVDFEIIKYKYTIDPSAKQHITNVLGKFDDRLMESYIHLFNNIAATQKFILKVIKD